MRGRVVGLVTSERVCWLLTLVWLTLFRGLRHEQVGRRN